MKDDYHVAWQVSKLTNVIDYFAQGFEIPKGEEIVRVGWWIDSTKGEVVFNLHFRKIKPADAEQIDPEE